MTPFSHLGHPLGDMRSGPDYTRRPKSFGYFSEGVCYYLAQKFPSSISQGQNPS